MDGWTSMCCHDADTVFWPRLRPNETTSHPCTRYHGRSPGVYDGGGTAVHTRTYWS